LAVDRAGALYVADSGNGRILRIAEGAVTTVAGGLQTPVAVAVDPAGGIYVADARAEVRTLTPTGAWTVFATLTAPHDVASDSGGNLYIADGVWIRRADTHGNVQTIAGDASEAALAAPAAVAVDGSGNLWIADPGAGRVRVVSPAGALRTAALAGASGIAVDAGGTIVAADPDHDRIIAIGPDGTVGNYAAATGPETALHGPRGVCANASAVFVADTANDRVLRVPPSGAVTLAAGSAAQLNLPGACAADGAGNLYIADTGNDRIRKVSPEGLITTVGNLDVHAPAGVAADDSGNLFVADTGGGRVLLVGADGTVHAIATGLSAPAGLALDSAGNLYVAESRAGLVRKLVRQDATAPVVLPPFSVVNAFSGQSGPVAPGELLTIAGAGLGPDAGTAAGLATSAAGVEVRFDGLAAPLLYVQAQQINVQAPYEIAGRESTHVEVFYQKQLAGAADVPVATAAPGLFPALTNPDGTPNGADSPAPRGAIMTFYATGAGLSDDGNVSGLPAGLALTHPRLPVTMTIGGFPAEILYAGSAPGLVGTMQVNARIPGGFLPPGAAAVLLNVGTAYARPVTIFVR
ncbi:MAG TPA: IPT/TIG domain-containing protein, partial [Bryobacteraceae bacterium]